MAYPDAPSKSFDYTGFEQSQGDGAFPGQEVDTDLDALIAAFTSLLTFIKNTHRSDGLLNNGIVRRETLAADISLGFGAPSVWETGTDYVVADSVFNGSKFYICAIAHTSGTFSTDLAAGRWEELADLSAGALTAANNLSDLLDVAAARGNLGLGGAATEDVVPVAKGGTGAASAAAARTALGLSIGAQVQAYSALLTAISGLTPTDGNVIVGDGSTWVAESGATARASLGLTIGSAVQAFHQRLADISGITYAQGDILYHNGSNIVKLAKGAAGQVLRMNAGATAPEWANNWTTFGEVATGSAGPIVLLSGLPAGVSEIELDWRNVSATTANNFLLQLEDGSGFVTSGYDGHSGGAGTSATIANTTGFPVRNGGASNIHSGTLHLKRPGGNTWVISRNVRNSVCGGSVALASAIEGLRITFDGGTPNFASGGISGRYR